MDVIPLADIRTQPDTITPHYRLYRHIHPHVNGFEENIDFAHGFSLVRRTLLQKQPVAYPAFDTLDYIGLCFCFAAAAPRKLAFPHLYHGHMNTSSGYSHPGGIDHPLNTPKYYISLRFKRSYLENLAASQPLPAWLHNLNRETGRCESIAVPAAIREQAWQLCRRPPAAHPAERLRLEAACLTWLAQLLEHHDSPSQHHPIEHALDIIHREYHTPLTIAQLARRSGINECYLKQQFRSRTGQSIAGYINTLRLQTACRLLRERPDLSIKTIATMSGHHGKYFSNWFARHQGISAKAWRAQHKPDKNSRNEDLQIPET